LSGRPTSQAGAGLCGRPPGAPAATYWSLRFRSGGAIWYATRKPPGVLAARTLPGPGLVNHSSAVAKPFTAIDGYDTLIGSGSKPPAIPCIARARQGSRQTGG
jgi:hypothetical protein